MVTTQRYRKSPILGTLFLVAILCSIANIQSGIVSVKALWTYPSGYDPHGGYVDRLIFIVYPIEDMSSAFWALQAGTVNSYDEQIPYQEVPELAAHTAIEVTSEPGTRYRQFTLNCARFPTNITGYRKALAYALDKPAVVENSRGGFAQVMDNPIPLAFEFWSYEDQMTSHFYAEDIASANATLDAAHIIDTPDSPHPGWRYYDTDGSGTWTPGDKRGDQNAPEGLSIELLVSAGYDPAIQAALVQIDGMEKCGLQGELAQFDFNLIGSSFLETGEFNCVCLSWNIKPPGDPTLLYDFFYSEGGSNAFFYRFNHSEYDDNCTKFMLAPTRLEARNWAWNCCSILMEEMPMIVCYNDECTHAYRTDTWEGYIPQVAINRMGGNPFTFHQIRLKEDMGGPFGCIPTEYVTVLSEGMDFTNPLLSDTRYTHTIMDLIYSRLWVIDPLDPYTQKAPDLAYNWWTNVTTASGDIHDGMKYTFQLYDNITWHDGTPFTSEDVQYSLMTIHPCGIYTADNVEQVYRVDTPDAYTVEIYSNDSSYLGFNEATSLQIYPKHIWSLYESSNFTWSPETLTDLTGTGCFQWGTRVTGQYIILTRYADWHFAVEHPDRPPCNQTFTPPLPPYGFLITIIIIQVIILVVLLQRRKERQKAYLEKGHDGESI